MKLTNPREVQDETGDMCSSSGDSPTRCRDWLAPKDYARNTGVRLHVARAVTLGEALTAMRASGKALVYIECWLRAPIQAPRLEYATEHRISSTHP